MLVAQGVGPMDTMPVMYQTGPEALLNAWTIRGPPLSPIQESWFLIPPAHNCLLLRRILKGRYFEAQLGSSTRGTFSFFLTGLLRPEVQKICLCIFFKPWYHLPNSVWPQPATYWMCPGSCTAGGSLDERQIGLIKSEKKNFF